MGLFACLAVGENSLGIPRPRKTRRRTGTGWSASLWPLDISCWVGKQPECDLLSGFRVQACLWDSSCLGGGCYTELGLSHGQDGEEIPHCLHEEHEGGSGWVETG